MCPRSTILGYYVLLLVALLSNTGGYSTISPKHTKELSEIKVDVLKDLDFYVEKFEILEYLCLLVSLPFLLLTFVVYSILTELQNMHGYTLRVHVASLCVTNVIDFCINEFPILLTGKYCPLIAYIYNFSILSTVFWLNAICFDIWWTLRQFRSYQTVLKKQKKKKVKMYLIYAWGISLIFNVVCAILDIPYISKNIPTPPGMCTKKFWFSYDGMRIYFYIPVSVIVIINICFFIATTLMIQCHYKQTADQLRDSSGSLHSKNKFTIYLKLFLMMGMNWVMKIILWWFKNFKFTTTYVSVKDFLPELILWFITKTIDILQGPIIFFASVWKKEIKLMLLKRIGWQDRDPANISRNNDRPCTSQNTISLTSISGTVSVQEEISPSNQQINHRAESYSQ